MGFKPKQKKVRRSNDPFHREEDKIEDLEPYDDEMDWVPEYNDKNY